jgi:hypothetical protein
MSQFTATSNFKRENTTWNNKKATSISEYYRNKLVPITPETCEYDARQQILPKFANR